MSMKTATIHRPGTPPFVRFCGYFAVIAGLLGILAGLRLIDKNPNLAELLYVAIDLCSLFAILGWHLHQQNKVGSVGLAGFFLAFTGTGFIAGPSAKIFGFTAYSLGIPVVALGLLTMSLCALRSRAIPGWILSVFGLSLTIMILSFYLPWLYQPISFFNIVFSIGFLGLGYTLIKEH